ncbi:hypothetical protein B484DRAFT_392477 [Ochromonadaceae sp. CCMP2298]|nr:hypothetical protein B484DRAFT_392477 [Ochromonadaceae sp. CCMP2298]
MSTIEREHFGILLATEAQQMRTKELLRQAQEAQEAKSKGLSVHNLRVERNAHDDADIALSEVHAAQERTDAEARGLPLFIFQKLRRVHRDAVRCEPRLREKAARSAAAAAAATLRANVQGAPAEAVAAAAAATKVAQKALAAAAAAVEAIAIAAAALALPETPSTEEGIPGNDCSRDYGSFI